MSGRTGKRAPGGFKDWAFWSFLFVSGFGVYGYYDWENDSGSYLVFLVF